MQVKSSTQVLPVVSAATPAEKAEPKKDAAEASVREKTAAPVDNPASVEQVGAAPKSSSLQDEKNQRTFEQSLRVREAQEALEERDQIKDRQDAQAVENIDRTRERNQNVRINIEQARAASLQAFDTREENSQQIEVRERAETALNVIGERTAVLRQDEDKRIVERSTTKIAAAEEFATTKLAESTARVEKQNEVAAQEGDVDTDAQDDLRGNNERAAARLDSDRVESERAESRASDTVRETSQTRDNAVVENQQAEKQVESALRGDSGAPVAAKQGEILDELS